MYIYATRKDHVGLDDSFFLRWPIVSRNDGIQLHDIVCKIYCIDSRLQQTAISLGIKMQVSLCSIKKKGIFLGY